ncbi:hypothetical protein KKA14_18395 [bacterium]|nr:hypothetical protein [bacterium]
MSIDTQVRVSNAESSLRNRAATPSKSDEELRKQDFMNLFMTQMSHQDPMDPMDSGSMMTQLAQLGSMEQLENVNGQLKEMNLNQKEISRFQALGFLDKDVMMSTETVDLVHGSGKPVHYKADQEINNLKINIEDLDGSPVFSQDLGLVTEGKHQFVWDGKNDEGTMMGDGKYKIRLLALKSDGSSSELSTYLSGRVSQVEYRKGQPWATINNSTIPVSKISTVDNMSSRIFDDAKPLQIMQNLEPKGIIESIGK